MKNIHFSIPKELYAEFHKLFPIRGDKAAFLRQTVANAVRHAEKKDHFARVKLGKEEKDE